MIARTQLMKRAHDVLRKYKIPKGKKLGQLALTTDVLLTCFEYFIHIKETLVDASELEPGDSRIYGRPHFPREIDWPKSTYFYAQLDMAAIKRFDVPNVLPDAGILYLFYDPTKKDFLPASKTAGRGILFDGDVDELVLRAPAKPKDLPLGGKYYRDHFTKQCSRVNFQPSFWLGDFDGIPTPLIDRLETELGIRYRKDRDTTIFGTPITWQGEDEYSLFTSGEEEEEDYADLPDRVLLLQRPFVDGHVHLWSDPKRTAKGDFSKLEATASS